MPALLREMTPQLDRVVAQTVGGDHFARVCLTVLKKTPKLMSCSPPSVLGGFMELAQLGLMPGVNGQAWLIPYGNTATVVIGYQGFVDLAYRSGQVASINADVVYAGDSFEWQKGLSPKLNHTPSLRNKDPEQITHAWCVIKTTLGGEVFDVMSRDEIDSIKARSRSGRSGPWVTDYARMAMKTVVRRVVKLAPSSAEFRRAVALDEQAEGGRDQDLRFNLGDPSDDEGTTPPVDGMDEIPE